MANHAPALTRRRSGVGTSTAKSVTVSTFIEDILQSNPLFRHLSATEAETLSKAFVVRDYPAGTCILHQGAPADDGFFIILSGRCDILLNGEPVNSVSAGSAVGELALLRDGGRRAATVVAVERTTAANLDSATFKALLLSHTAAIVPPPMSRSPSLAPSPAAARAMPVPMPKSGSPARRPSRSPLRQRWARAGAAIIASRRLLSRQETLAQRRLALPSPPLRTTPRSLIERLPLPPEPLAFVTLLALGWLAYGIRKVLRWLGLEMDGKGAWSTMFSCWQAVIVIWLASFHLRRRWRGTSKGAELRDEGTEGSHGDENVATWMPGGGKGTKQGGIIAYRARLPLLRYDDAVAAAPASPSQQALNAARGALLLDRRQRKLGALLRTHHGLPPTGPCFRHRCSVHAARESTFTSIASQLLDASPQSLAAGLVVEIDDEPGVDAGGITCELLALCASQVGEEGEDSVWTTLDDGGVFLQTARGASAAAASTAAADANAATPDAAAAPPLPAVALAEAFGRLVGSTLSLVCVHGHSYTLPLPICLPLLKMICDAALLADDVRTVDPLGYRFRVAALQQPGGIESVAALVCESALHFTAETQGDEHEHVGEDGEVELCLGGKSLEVTPENLPDFIPLLCEHMLCDGRRRMLCAFLRGMWAVVPLEALLCSELDPHQLGLSLSGIADLSIDEWRYGTRIDRTGGGPDCTVQEAARRAAQFFRVVERYTDEIKARLLFFATGLKRLPPGGFDRLQPKFTLQLLGKEHKGFLPVAHTCFNTVQLGIYESDEHLERMLNVSLEIGADSFSDE